jgi:hypothetical protein
MIIDICCISPDARIKFDPKKISLGVQAHTSSHNVIILFALGRFWPQLARINQLIDRWNQKDIIIQLIK